MKLDSTEKKPRLDESVSITRSLVWLVVILVGLTGVLVFAYRVKRQLSPAEYEGKIVDKWAGYSHSETGSQPYFRLVVERAGGQRTTVAVDQETYGRASVGMWIRKTRTGIELSSLTASPLDVKWRIETKRTVSAAGAAEGSQGQALSAAPGSAADKIGEP